MRLINVRTLKLESFIGEPNVYYAILSHTWGEEEVLYEDFQQPWKIHHKSGLRPAWWGKIAAEKVRSSCARALKDGFNYIWIDTCCIDKSSSAELSEAINSMFKWYGRALQCYAYLEDVNLAEDDARGPDDDGGWEKTALAGSRWFTRGWTLQELIAPQDLELYDRCWKSIGTRDELAPVLEEITGISRIILRRPLPEYHLEETGRAIVELLGCVSAACKMSWAAHRRTTRPEDEAYCLMGLFDVNMPLLYGEGRKAFLRLQEEIIRTTSDQSILAHNQPDEEAMGILADNPSQFVTSIVKSRDVSLQAWAYVAGELSLDVWLVDVDGIRQAAILDCRVEGEQLSWPVIVISKMPGAQGKYMRSDSRLRKIVADDWGEFVLVPHRGPRPSPYLPPNGLCPSDRRKLNDLDLYKPKIDMTAARRQRITLVSSPDSDFEDTLERKMPLEVRGVVTNSLELRSKVSFDDIRWVMGSQHTVGVTGFWLQTRTTPITMVQGDRTVAMTCSNWSNMSGGISRSLKFFVLWQRHWASKRPPWIERDSEGTAVKILRPDEFFNGENEAGPDPWSKVIERLSLPFEETVRLVESCLRSRNKSVEDRIEIGGLWITAKFSQVSVLNRVFPRLDVKVE